MKKMSKFFCLITAMTILVTGCGCNKGEDRTQDKSNTETSTEINPNYDTNDVDVLLEGEIKVGDTIKFGSYEQDNDISNGKESIEWLVLDKENGKVLVVSKQPLDCKPYNEEFVAVTWETCTLRGWLNEDFINTAFTDRERALIPTVTVEAHENPAYDIDVGNATEDRIFLLSIVEVNQYFGSDSERVSCPTAYAEANGVYVFEDACWWWLRTPGFEQKFIASVHFEGLVEESASPVDFAAAGVRPAMWIDLAD